MSEGRTMADIAADIDFEIKHRDSIAAIEQQVNIIAQQHGLDVEYCLADFTRAEDCISISLKLVPKKRSDMDRGL